MKNQNGFTTAEAILAVVILAIISGVGWLVYKNHHKAMPENTAKSSIISSAKTTNNSNAGWKTYTAADNTYIVKYPSNWVSNSCSKDNSCSITSEVDNYLSPPQNVSSTVGLVVTLGHNKTSLNAKSWFNSFKNIPGDYSCVYNPKSLTINGYDGYFAEYLISFQPNQCPGVLTTGTITNDTATRTGYTDYYSIVHNGQAVIISMPVQDGSNGTYNTVPLVSTFNQIVNSIKFNN